MKKTAQWLQVLDALKALGGVATLSQLNRALLGQGGVGTNWKTKTPDATIRRIVRQKSDHFHCVRPGLYCLKEQAARFDAEYSIPQQDELTPAAADRGHWYYQGLLVEIGNARNYTTYVPAQDKNRAFVNQKLGEICGTTRLPNFGYQTLMSSARTVDVIWFNRRRMPAEMFEVEMSTDMRNSLIKFNELRDFYTKLTILAPPERKRHFDDRIEMDTFHEIRGRVKFIGIDALEERYAAGRWPA